MNVKPEVGLLLVEIEIFNRIRRCLLEGNAAKADEWLEYLISRKVKLLERMQGGKKWN